MEATPSPATPHYQRPDWFTRNVFNRLVKLFTRMGISVWGSRVLEHRGRTSGKLHHTPVNLLTYEGAAVSRRPPRRHPVGPQRAQRGRAPGAHPRPAPRALHGQGDPGREQRPDPSVLPEALGVRDRHVLRWHHGRRQRRRLGGRGAQAPGLRSGELSSERRGAATWRHGGTLEGSRARPDEPDCVQPSPDPLEHQGRRRRSRRVCAVRGWLVATGGGEQRVPHRAGGRRVRPHRTRRILLRTFRPRLLRQGARHQRGRRPARRVAGGRSRAVRFAGAADAHRGPAPRSQGCRRRGGRAGRGRGRHCGLSWP